MFEFLHFDAIISLLTQISISEILDTDAREVRSAFTPVKMQEQFLSLNFNVFTKNLAFSQSDSTLLVILQT